MDPNSGKILLRFYLTVGLTENTTFDSVLHMLRMVLQTDVKRQAVVGTCLGQNILEITTIIPYKSILVLKRSRSTG